MSFAQFCILWPLKCDPQSLSVWWGYPHMGFGLSNPLIIAAWLGYGERKTWWRHSSHTNQSMLRMLSVRSTSIINLPVSHQLGTSVDSPRLLWQLPWALFRAHRTCCYCIYQVTIFQGQFSIPSNTSFLPSTAVAILSMHPICCLLKDQLLGLD